MVSLVIVSPYYNIEFDLEFGKPLKTATRFEWSIDVFGHSHYTINIKHFFINIVNIEKFQSLQAFTRLGTIHILPAINKNLLK
ncbi:hypothetical protein VN0647_08370 [Helicobacter pylori]|nr:hypothetical protein VN0647_08370 [Helicobacter pylori]